MALPMKTLRRQDYIMYARRTSSGPVPGVPYHWYGTSLQGPDPNDYWSLFIGSEPAHMERRFLLARTDFIVCNHITEINCKSMLVAVRIIMFQNDTI